MCAESVTSGGDQCQNPHRTALRAPWILHLRPATPLLLLEQPGLLPLATAVVWVIPQLMQRFPLGHCAVEQRPVHQVDSHGDAGVALRPKRLLELTPCRKHVP